MIERLVEDSYNNKYFWKLYNKISRIFFENTLKINDDKLTEKELIDILRFADIFSNSKLEDKRNLANRIISLLYNQYKEDDKYRMYSNAVLKKLDNFPVLKNTPNVELPLERELEHLSDKEKLKAPLNDEYFLPNQYYIYEQMKLGKSLSFSGPTSMGKSFVIKQFVISLIKDNLKSNFCIVVPTRALIKQYLIDLNKELKLLNLKSHRVLTNANMLDFLNIKDNNYIFILTPERLNVLLCSNNTYIDYLVVDEAHKLFDEDVRGLTFYNSIDTCISRFKEIKVFFSSPLIQNPDLFKNTYNNKPIQEYKTHESPVSQNLFYVDLEEGAIELIDNEALDIDIKGNYSISNKEELYHKVGDNSNNIIYVSSRDRAIKYSNEFTKYLTKNKIDITSDLEKEEIEKVCLLIEDNIHKEYFLISALRKGIGYHYGKMPTIVRDSIENLFKDGIIKYLFCTSTLLEGVNLPAKNIFIMADYNGNRKMKSLDFWNLAGRAGRLGYEHYGNIFCVNAHDRRGAWKNRDILCSKNEIKISDNLSENIKKQKETIKDLILNKEPIEDLKEKQHYINYLSNIIQIDSITNNKSKIVKKANGIDSEIINLCEEKDEKINYDIVNMDKTIDYKVQKNIFISNEIHEIANNVTYKECLSILDFMFYKYRWDIKESNLNNKNKLKYIALLMNLWINGKPLNEIINESISFKYENKKIIKLSYNDCKVFDKLNKSHINALINEIMEDIENILRFDLEKYFNHYHKFLVSKYGDEVGSNWALYLEFGTRSDKNIMLQNAGFSRYTSNILVKGYSKYLSIKDMIFNGIDESILNDEKLKDNRIVYNEIVNSSYINLNKG